MGLDDNHFHSHRCPQEVNHLLMGQRGHGHLADLHEPAPLAKACLPGKAERLHVGDDSFKVHMEAKLTQPVSSQGHLHGLAASRYYLRGKEAVRQVWSFPLTTTDGTLLRTHVHTSQQALSSLALSSATPLSLQVTWKVSEYRVHHGCP